MARLLHPPTSQHSLLVYVDDFKLAAPKKNLQAFWKRIGQKLSLEPPTPLGRFLGCETRPFEAILDPSQNSGFHKFGAARGPGGEEQSSAPEKGHYNGV